MKLRASVLLVSLGAFWLRQTVSETQERGMKEGSVNLTILN